jgi:hypothetical protein
LKLGKRYADVVWISDRCGIEEGKEELVMATLLYGYYRNPSAITLMIGPKRKKGVEVGTTYIRINSSPSQQLLDIRCQIVPRVLLLNPR